MRKHPFLSAPAPGVLAALASAALFGVAAPLCKRLLGQVDPWLLAALLYLGSGLGLTAYRVARGLPLWPALGRGQWPWLLGAIALGGGVAPVLLMWGLTGASASSAALLLNVEGVFTALIAWFVFHENFDRRIALGLAAMVAGAAVLGWGAAGASAGGGGSHAWWPMACVVGACLCWALDNNLTNQLALHDSVWLASVKGLAAGSVNLALALALHASAPSWQVSGTAMAIGLLCYGVSLAWFVVGMRHLGAARAGAYFSLAPFVGAVFSLVLLHEPLTWQLAVAAGLMGAGLWLHLTERHGHWHGHESAVHSHSHDHGSDPHGHHAHSHADASEHGDGRHTHEHRHDALAHSHAHTPDAHHQHKHG